jgi:isopropylmalate/homocitrate/citramalate synthase
LGRVLMHAHAHTHGLPAQRWHTDLWFTSPWNHEADVQSEIDFSPKLQIHDVTLRDGEQQAGVEFSADDKKHIAEALAAAGVQRIEAGLPAVSPEDERAVREIAAMGLPSEIYAFSRCMLDDVKRAVECGVEGVVMEIPSSRHLIELGYRWSVERAIELSVEATTYAHDQGLKVSFFPIDATRGSITEYLDLVSAVADSGHMDALVLVDTFGVLTPHAVGRFVRESRDRLNVPLETHFHMDYGLGVANSLVAAAMGVETIQVTVSGIGERAGNVPLEELGVALRTLYDIDVGLRLEHFTGLAKLVERLSGVPQPTNRPVTGDRLFDIESGIITTWFRNVRDTDVTEVLPYHPSLVGQTGPRVVFGKGSGLDSVVEGLEQCGLTATDEERQEILVQVKAASLARRDTIGIEAFRQIAERVVAT